MTADDMTVELTLRGYTPPRGGSWYPAQIKAIRDLKEGPTHIGK